MIHKYVSAANWKAKKDRQRRNFLWMVKAACITATVLIFALPLFISKPVKPKPTPLLIEGRRAGIPKDQRGDSKLWQAWIQAAQVAGKKWEATGVRVPVLSLIADRESCAPDAIACADTDSKIVYVSQDGASVDRVTIMMHEIAHVLGVPHIEGDPMMDRAYQNTALEAPSDAAVAIALSKQRVSFEYRGLVK